MENINNIKVSIPKPCHEDWNKMTPNEQGAFCKMCAKSVIDFTQKSVQELKQYLLERREEKVCGRVNSNQLDVNPIKKIALCIPFNLIPKRLSLNNAFAIALFLTFGTALFSCNTENGHTVGEIGMVTDSTKVKDTLKDMGQVVILDTAKQVKKGEIKSEDEKIKKQCVPLTGDIAVETTKEEIINETHYIVNGGLKMEIDTVEKPPMVGKMKIE